MKRPILILSFSLVFLIGTIASSPDIMGEASSGWQAAVQDILLLLSQDQFQLDIVTVHGNARVENDNNVSLLLRNDNNKYFRTDMSSSIRPIVVNVADVNNDGHQDIIGIGTQRIGGGATEKKITVFLGIGDGTFQAEIISDTVFSPNNQKSTIVADFDNNGFMDLVLVEFEGAVHFGNNDGTFVFPPEQRFPTSGSDGVAAADFDGDLFLDIATPSSTFDSLSIHLNNGDGTFGPEVIIFGHGDPVSVATADFDNDGNQDIVTAGDDGNVKIFFGDGTGNLASWITLTINLMDVSPNSVAVGDFNNDGNQDIVTSNNFQSTSVILGNGDMTFQRERNFGTGFGTEAVLVADLNSDGNQDLITLNTKQQPNTVSVLFGDGNGSFDPKINDFRVKTGADDFSIGNFKTLP